MSNPWGKASMSRQDDICVRCDTQTEVSHNVCEALSQAKILKQKEIVKVRNRYLEI